MFGIVFLLNFPEEAAACGASRNMTFDVIGVGFGVADMKAQGIGMRSGSGPNGPPLSPPNCFSVVFTTV